MKAPTKEFKEAIACENRRASWNYAIDDTIEAGLALTGSEVKSLRAGEASLSDAYALPERDELFLHNAHIGAYRGAATFGHLPTRRRKLLLHRQEIDKWATRVRERGYSIIPLAIYFKNGRAKVRLGLGKGKKHHDRRDALRRQDDQREMERSIRRR